MAENLLAPVEITRGEGAELPEPAWVRDLREAAADRFQSMEWPTPMEEEWRRTDLSRFDLSRFAGLPTQPRPLLPAPQGALPEGFAGSVTLETGATARVFLAGYANEQGVRLLDLREALEEYEDPLRRLFESGLREADNRFIPWHYSGPAEGAVLAVPPGVQVPEPFLIDVRTNGHGPLAAPRIVVLVGQGARVAVIQRSVGPAASEGACNALCELAVEDGARLAFHEAQELGERTLVFRHCRATVGAGARLLHFDAAFGGRLVKSRMDCSLLGSGADAQLKGVYFPHRGQHMDIRTVQRHAAPSASSRGFYKGAVQDDGRAIFQGLIEVSPGASRTDAFLTNRNLVLNDGARSDSIPSLKIGNNDVKCSHGSTTGRIDEAQMFYLQSRGMSRAEAREMLVTGYFEEIAGDAPDAFRSRVLEAVRARLLPAEKGL
jgi:Fe-S cluster assembly protein SufD